MKCGFFTDDQFALYMTRLGAANSSLLQKLREDGEETPTDTEKRALLAYVLGHVLFNSVLKYPGPILSASALCAYVSTDAAEADMLAAFFADAAYAGLFSQGGRFFWRDKIDQKLDGLGNGMDEEKFATSAEFYRAVIERAIARTLANHSCDRCGGILGGFVCPFTHRAVCLRQDCSVAASSWIPQGAQLCRVEKSFYDEWAPLLGL